MREIPNWDTYYLDICRVVATRSKDPNTQIGCVIVGPAHEIRSTGYNPFRGASERRGGAAGAAGEVFMDRARRAQRDLQRGAGGHGDELARST